MEEVMQWNPIETVPSGDKGFLVWDAQAETCYAVYKHNGKWYDHRNGMEVDDEDSFTHWMPFPDAPRKN